MNIDKKSLIFLGSGLLLLVLGALPLNGYVIFLFRPQDFVPDDPFSGSAFHLLLGLIPWLLGAVLMSLGTEKIWHGLAIMLASFALGTFMALVPLINGNGRIAYCTFLAIAAVGVILSVIIRILMNACSKQPEINSPNIPQDPQSDK